MGLRVAAAVAVLATAFAITTASGAPPYPGALWPPEHCTAKAFRPFSARVWDPSKWARGAPKHAVIAAQRRRLKCAPPGHRTAMIHRWRLDQGRYFAHRHHCRSGPVWAGKVSTFSGGLTAGGYQATEPGIALRSSATLGETFLLSVGGRHDYVLQTDWGPASWTGRVIDITEAEAAIIGGVVTDSWGTAKQIPGGCL